MTTKAVFVGIDVAQTELVTASRPAGEVWATAYTEAGMGELVERLQQLRPELIVLEATGGLEVPVAAALAAAAGRFRRLPAAHRSDARR